MARYFLCVVILLILFLNGPNSTSQTSSHVSKQRVVVIKTRENAFYNPAVLGFTNGLKARGYRSGEQIELVVVAFTGKADEDAALVQEQLGKKPSLMITIGTDATRLVAAQKPTIPVLFSMILDPVTLGLVKTPEIPGGYFSGTTLLVSPGKQFDALLQAAPKVHKIGVLYTEKDLTSLAFIAEAALNAKSLNIEIDAIPVEAGRSSMDALNSAKAHDDALWLIPDPASTGQKALSETLEYANKNHLPILGSSGGTVKAGALLSLSAALDDLGDITAEMASYILAGTGTTAQMRVRGPRRTLLSVNLNTAKRLGITIPGTMLHLADEVIDVQKDDN